jgi:hypothetical protein
MGVKNLEPQRRFLKGDCCVLYICVDEGMVPGFSDMLFLRTVNECLTP